MATKKEFKLVDGQYYTAVVNRKKIRGIVWWDGENQWYLLNNQGVGDSYEDFDDDCKFNHGLYMSEEDEDFEPISHSEMLKKHKVNQFQVVTDKRVKKVIDNDAVPEILGYRVRKKGDTYIFGCGAVRLTKKQITN